MLVATWIIHLPTWKWDVRTWNYVIFFFTSVRLSYKVEKNKTKQ